jgi:hypothetical protein
MSTPTKRAASGTVASTSGGSGRNEAKAETKELFAEVVLKTAEFTNDRILGMYIIIIASMCNMPRSQHLQIWFIGHISE